MPQDWILTDKVDSRRGRFLQPLHPAHRAEACDVQLNEWILARRLALFQPGDLNDQATARVKVHDGSTSGSLATSTRPMADAPCCWKPGADAFSRHSGGLQGRPSTPSRLAWRVVQVNRVRRISTKQEVDRQKWSARRLEIDNRRS